MNSGKKSVSKHQVMILGGVVAFLVYCFTIGKETPLGKHADNYLQKVKKISEEPIGKITNFIRSFDGLGENVPEHQAILDACMDEMFVEKSGFHFSQSRGSGSQVPYQFRGLELIGPEKLPPNAGDIQRGIEQRIRYTFHVAAYRRYDPTKNQWEAWNFDQPPNLTEMIFARQGDTWKIAVAPHKSYAIR